jgi:hypothetical protein
VRLNRSQYLIITLITWRIDESRLKLRGFLSPLTPEVRHRNIADQLTLGTGKWFLENHAFGGWAGLIGSAEDNRRDRVLCCVGNPGVGKTGLAYAVPPAISLEVEASN